MKTKKQEIYFIVKKGSSNIIHTVRNSGEHKGSKDLKKEAKHYITSFQKSEFKLFHTKTQLQILSKDQFIKKFGKKEIGHAEA